MPLVAFDSNCCIWCFKSEFTSGQEYEKQSAIKLKELLIKHNFQILLPIPVVTELLSNINDPLERINLFQSLKKNLIIGDFNAKAAILLAEILNYHYTNKKTYQNIGITKVSLKYDALIIAIAKAYNAECLYAHDPDCKTIAAHFYTVKKISEIPDSIQPQDFF